MTDNSETADTRTDGQRTETTAGGEGVGRRTVLKAAGVSAATAALAGCSALLGGGDGG